MSHQESLDRRKEMIDDFYSIVNTCDLRSAYAKRVLEGYLHGVEKVEGNEKDEATPVPSPPAPAPALGSIVSLSTPIAPSAKDTLEKRWADYEKMIIYWKDNSYLNQVRYKHYFPDGCRVKMFGKEDSVESQLDHIDKMLREIRSNREKNYVDTSLEAKTNGILDTVDKNIACINLKMLERIDRPPSKSHVRWILPFLLSNKQ